LLDVDTCPFKRPELKISISKRETSSKEFRSKSLGAFEERTMEREVAK